MTVFEQNKLSVGLPSELELTNKGLVASLIWGFVRTTASQLRRIKREEEERKKRSEPVYNVKFFNFTLEDVCFCKDNRFSSSKF